jgi:hypothetical protein
LKGLFPSINARQNDPVGLGGTPIGGRRATQDFLLNGSSAAGWISSYFLVCRLPITHFFHPKKKTNHSFFTKKK